MSDLNKKEIKKDIVGENSLLSLLEMCLNEIENIVESENIKEKEEKEEKEEKYSLRKDRGCGLSFVDSIVPEGIELNNAKSNKLFDIEKNSKYIADVISDFILETVKNPNKPRTSEHSSPNIMSEIFGHLKKDDNFEETVFNIRNLTPKNLEILMSKCSIEEIASKYGVSIDEIEFLCQLWDIEIDKKDVQIYFVNDSRLFNIVQGYLSIIESIDEENNVELIKHFIESFNYSLSFVKPQNIDIDGIVLPIICNQFDTTGDMCPSLMLIGVKSNLSDIIKEIEVYGYFDYVDNLLQ